LVRLERFPLLHEKDNDENKRNLRIRLVEEKTVLECVANIDLK
jgi:hypothetical protein